MASVQQSFPGGGLPGRPVARSVAERLASAGKPASVVCHPDAGHRVLLPGETTPRSAKQAHGGTDRADMELGQAAWAAIVRLLRLQGLAHRIRRRLCRAARTPTYLSPPLARYAALSARRFRSLANVSNAVCRSGIDRATNGASRPL